MSNQDASNEAGKAVESLHVSLSPSDFRQFQEAATKAGRTPEEFLTSIAIQASKKREHSAEARSQGPEPIDPDKPIVILHPLYGQVQTTLREFEAANERDLRYARVFDELMRADDRSAGILGGAFIDEALREFIKAYASTLTYHTDEGRHQKFGTFGTKLSLAHFAGIIWPDGAR